MLLLYNAMMLLLVDNTDFQYTKHWAFPPTCYFHTLWEAFLCMILYPKLLLPHFLATSTVACMGVHTITMTFSSVTYVLTIAKMAMMILIWTITWHGSAIWFNAAAMADLSPLSVDRKQLCECCLLFAFSVRPHTLNCKWSYKLWK
jgi:hypothetical protein